MGVRFKRWISRSSQNPESYEQLEQIVLQNRSFKEVERLEYGNHGLEDAFEVICEAIKANKRIALYADYDVDGTMSCVSWIWFLRGIGYENFIHYIPDRFKEGYGVNLQAVQYLALEEKAEIIITMDTGITANQEAQWCRDHGVEFICTDHHKVQPDKMPDCIILNPKLHPDPMYQELCGCGITFVLLRKLGQIFPLEHAIWTDILAITGIATICDVVPLNGVNHKLAQQGVMALTKSKRPVLKELMRASSVEEGELDETDIGFRLGPKINAVGRLEHAHVVVDAFIGGEPHRLIKHMGECNEKRKQIQKTIVEQAREQARLYPDDPVLFLGGDWHQGVVGIAASKIAEEFWRPVWLFQKGESQCKGSARSIPGFDVTEAMLATGGLFEKFGGHKAAGGFSFCPENEAEIRAALIAYAQTEKNKNPNLWQSAIEFDCKLPTALTEYELVDTLQSLRPYGHQFESPLFCLETEVLQIDFYKDKVTGLPKHTAVSVPGPYGEKQKIMFFNEVYSQLKPQMQARFIVSPQKNTFRGRTRLSLIGSDYEALP